MSRPSKALSRGDISLHNKDGDLWIIVDDVVFDLSEFQEEHPGGKKVLVGVAATDATKKFRKYHGNNVLRKYDERLRVGTVERRAEGPATKKCLFRRLRTKS